MPVAGERGYVVVTKDRAIRRTPMEVAIVRNSRVLYFALTRGNMTSEQMSAAILAAWPHIARIARSGKGRRAVIARITSVGRVNIGETWP